MKSSKKEIIIKHSATDLYEIVLDIEKYPEFIPWCSSSKIQKKTDKNIIADLIIEYKLFSKVFTSNVNFNKKDLTINVLYIKGPLKNIITKWKFEAIENKKTKVYFLIEFEFKNYFFQKITNIFFDLIENKMIDSFKKRADDILD